MPASAGCRYQRSAAEHPRTVPGTVDNHPQISRSISPQKAANGPTVSCSPFEHEHRGIVVAAVWSFRVRWTLIDKADYTEGRRGRAVSKSPREILASERVPVQKGNGEDHTRHSSCGR